MLELISYTMVFFCLLLWSTFFVVITSSPVQSVLGLILSFIFSCCLFIVFGVEFVGIVLLVVYVGAISILFLFIVMMFNLKILELYSDFYKHLPVGFLIVGVCLCCYILTLIGDFGLLYPSILYQNEEVFFFWYIFLFWSINIKLLSIILFNFYFPYIILAGVILFLSMIGSILLTIDLEPRGRRKDSNLKWGDFTMVQSFSLDDSVNKNFNI